MSARKATPAVDPATIAAVLKALGIDASALASAPVKQSRPRKKVNTFYRDVIVGKAPARAARRELAASMRAKGLEPKGDAWEQAKAEAGIA